MQTLAPTKGESTSREPQNTDVVDGGLPAPLPENEEARLEALERYSILDTLEEEEYDDLARAAAEICGRPIGLVSLVDRHRQWFKAHHGLDNRETPREHAFCAHAILDPQQPFVVPDAHEDRRFAANPLVVGPPHVRAYVGIPLRDPRKGLPLGTLCVIDHEPRDVTERQLRSLWGLARQVERLLELRVANRELLDRAAELEATSVALEVANRELLLRGRTMRLLLDNVEQGLLVVDRTALVPRERSRAVDRWFGAPPPQAMLWDLLLREAPALRPSFQNCWGALVDGDLPLERALEQLPARVSSFGCDYTVQYTPVEPWEENGQLLVSIVEAAQEPLCG